VGWAARTKALEALTNPPHAEQNLNGTPAKMPRVRGTPAILCRGGSVANKVTGDKTMGERQTAASIATQHLCRLATEGVLKAGYCLPGERQLARELGVGRQAVREAINRLVANGILSRRRRKGAMVRAKPALLGCVPDFQVTESQREEARHAITPYVASLASQRASVEDRTELARAVRGMFLALGDVEAFRRFDIEFHEILSRACGNPILGSMMAGANCRVPAGAPDGSGLQSRTALADTHRQLYRAVRSGNPIRAGSMADALAGMNSAWLSKECRSDIGMAAMPDQSLGIESVRVAASIPGDLSRNAPGSLLAPSGRHADSLAPTDIA
jgi:GntR family transcriptional regulator, transcriptional repressor for pyruvate dehydrogenase complex